MNLNLINGQSYSQSLKILSNLAATALSSCLVFFIIIMGAWGTPFSIIWVCGGTSLLIFIGSFFLYGKNKIYFREQFKN